MKQQDTSNVGKQKTVTMKQWMKNKGIDTQIMLINAYEELKSQNKSLAASNKELREALEDIKNMETSGSRFDILQIVNKALNNTKTD